MSRIRLVCIGERGSFPRRQSSGEMWHAQLRTRKDGGSVVFLSSEACAHVRTYCVDHLAEAARGLPWMDFVPFFLAST